MIGAEFNTFSENLTVGVDITAEETATVVAVLVGTKELITFDEDNGDPLGEGEDGDFMGDFGEDFIAHISLEPTSVELS